MLQLVRHKNTYPDDLDAIVTAINEAQSESKLAFQKVNEEIQERRSAEAKLEANTEELELINNFLEQTNREQSEFTYALSHDLKSPTNTISVITKEFKQDHYEYLSEDGQELVDYLESTSDRMALLIDDVLSYSTTIGGDLQVESLDLNQIVDDVVADLRGEVSAGRGRYSGR